MQLKVRRFYTFIEHVLADADAQSDVPLCKVAVAAVMENPYAGRYVQDLQPLVDASASLGRELAARAVQALAPYKAQNYGKAAIVGIDGEQEHANAMITSAISKRGEEAGNDIESS